MAAITPKVFLEFLHLAGIIIGLGAVTVVDTMGFISRNSKKWTQVTIDAHHVTKPLIWLGIALIVPTWLLRLYIYPIGSIASWKTGLLAAMILNGCFLSFYVSPYLDGLKGKDELVSKRLKRKITVSAIISFLSWWSFVFLTVVSKAF
ncbi:MAG: hypothetical protein SVV03_03030 [Candidatus Nanohaloarchaea archaeon]|nr:hypothetical protein [Candidatus Nanohaloarchaea archaeon]